MYTEQILYTEDNRPNYNHYSIYLKKKFNNQKVYKMSLDAGFTCPNRDGTKGWGGCHYCNVDSFTPPNVRRKPTLAEQVASEKKKLQEMYGVKKFIAYFQPNTNTYAPVETLKKYYDEALMELGDDAVGLAIGTRIDCLDSEKIALINSYAKNYDVTLEIGIESIYDATLKSINRGHGIQDLLDGMSLLKNRDFKLCVHTIFGFPNETKEMQLAVAGFINKLDIDFIKLHQLHITKNSLFDIQYKKNPFPLYSLESYAEFLSEFIPKLKPSLIIERLFATSYPKELIAPKWDTNRSEVHQYLEKYLMEHNITQGSEFNPKVV